MNTCRYIVWYAGVSLEQILIWNPSLSYNISNPTACSLEKGYRYCVIPPGTLTNHTATLTSASTVTTTATGTEPDYYVCVGVDSDISSVTATPTSTSSIVVTPTPVQPRIVPSCDEFYFVQPGDECGTLAKSHGIALGDFHTWNPAVKNDCGGLQANVYVRVGVSSSNITPSPSKSTGSALSTPTPTQAGMTGSCGSFYYVKPNDGCWDIAHNYSIELQDFYSWNPAVGDNCQGLQANVYVCVGLLA
ncbi:hypothetical protein BDV33DRAFT_209667 [Aspergillus novoparasiticus]|uniref:LysM domain-containing protein n=1 Tax=Aspergillus novoparasiticus TaxID=986946 RepID=A0A5N6E8V2_9EURO|nr:hypothetical protein BDV33DRAFT_209667 [Aspergillus novoparasiticus]